MQGHRPCGEARTRSLSTPTLGSTGSILRGRGTNTVETARRLFTAAPTLSSAWAAISFAQSRTPQPMEPAWRDIGLTVQVATKLKRKQAYPLPRPWQRQFTPPPQTSYPCPWRSFNLLNAFSMCDRSLELYFEQPNGREAERHRLKR